MSTHQIRVLESDAEVDAAFKLFLRAMVGLPFQVDDGHALTEAGRFLGAFDGDQLVASADSYTSWLTVPGGARLPHAAVTHVGVAPTHRRRGLVRALITRQLEDAAERGEAVATLRASEAVIYERFGYGVATSLRSARIALHRAALRDSFPAGGDVRIVDEAFDRDLLVDIAERTNWTGAIHRPTGWWELRLRFLVGGPTPNYVVVHSTDGVDDGFAVYHPENTAEWFGGRERTVTVTDLVATNDGARAGLWRHLLSLDLVDTVAVQALPLDDPLPLALVDRRAIELGAEHDETWLRLVDVEAALEARSYAPGETVVIGVVDDLRPGNSGTYAIGEDGGVTRTGGAAEVDVDVATLAAVYLGGTRWRQLARVGRVVEHVPGAVARADARFAVGTAPFSGTLF